MEVVDAGGHKIIIIDNFYEKNEYEDILNECLFLAKRDKLLSEEHTGGAKRNGMFIKKNSGLFLDDTFFNRNISDILFHNRKIFNSKIFKDLPKIDSIYNYAPTINRDRTLLSYYETGDYYRSHRDNAVITVLSWFYKEPKSFVGGDVIFGEETSNVLVECKNNRIVIFPSFLKHEVTEIRMLENKNNQGYGRFALTQFLQIA